jgi:hypothetical protein
MKRWLRFNVLLWCGAVLVVLWLLVWPLIMNAWAGSHWTRTPCRIASDKVRYFYEVDGYTYNTDRADFWSRKTVYGKEKHPLPFAADSVCWVNPRDPEDAVLHLDAPQKWSHGSGRLSAAVVIVVVVAIGTRLGVGKKKPAAG